MLRAAGFLLPLLSSVTVLLVAVCVMIAGSSHGYPNPIADGAQKGRSKSLSVSVSVSALFVFGDSTVDPGNNDFIATVAKSNFPPYGIDFPQQTPTGRFSNGLLATDFIASYLGIKDTVPPYLDPKLSLDDLLTGVSFASAGSGYDPQTSSTNGAIEIEKQLEYLKEYKTRLEESIGKEKTEETIEKAIFVVSAGTNDLAGTFATPTIWSITPPVSTYQRHLLNLCNHFIQGLMQQGAKRIAVIGVPPIGCLPVVITANSNTQGDRSCIASLSSIARGYNQMLQAELKALQQQSAFMNHHAIVAYVDIYNLVDDYVNDPGKYGFEVVDRGCCGSGLLEESVACNLLSGICSDRTKYLFWDAIHPTQTTYSLVAQSVRPVIDFLAAYHQ
ncbi:hypothetical protein Dimus_035235 [Dionaea muscipula]